jgi:hypothetical protein
VLDVKKAQIKTAVVQNIDGNGRPPQNSPAFLNFSYFINSCYHSELVYLITYFEFFTFSQNHIQNDLQNKIIYKL